MRESASKRLAISAVLVAALLFSLPFAAAADARTTRVLIGYDPTNASAVQRLVQSVGGRIVFQYTIVSALAADVPSRSVKMISTNSAVAYAEADAARYVSSHILPLQPWTGSPEILPWGVEKVRANEVWDANDNLAVDANAVAGQGVKVAVLDTGVDLTHPDLVGNLVPLSAYCAGGDICDFIDMDSNPSDTPGEFQGHGSSASGNIAAVDNRIGVIGVAPKAKILMYRVCDALEGICPTSAIIAGINEAVEDDARIISMSFGGPASVHTERVAISNAFNEGLLLVASSGNEGRPPVGFPAALPEVIAVGATDITDTIADFSSFGFDQELVGPGVDVPTTTVQGVGRETLFSVVSGFAPTGGRQTNPLEFSALGSIVNKMMRYVGLGTTSEVATECTVTCTGQLALIKRGDITFQEKVENAASAGFAGAVIFNNQPGNFFGTLGEPSAIPAGSISFENGDPIRAAIQGGASVFGSLVVVASAYESVSGTSFSCPYVSGVAALVWSKNPGLTNTEVRAILQGTAIDLGASGYDTTYGFGRVDALAAVAATPAP